MNQEDPKNLRGFSDHFSQEFVIPQISFWLNNVFKKPADAHELKKDYYEGMEKAVKDLKRKFSPPYNRSSHFPLHDVVISIEEVERLKGIIGDNYHYLKNKIAEKEKLGVSFVNTKEEKNKLEKLDTYLNHVVPNFLDSLQRNFFIPFELLKKTDENIEKGATSYSQEGIFLCHSSKDKEIVRKFRNLLEDEGVTVWFDESQILPGDSITGKIAKGMEKTKYVALFVSENLNLENMSQYVGWELSMAKIKDLGDDRGRLIPIMIGKSSIKTKLPQEVSDKNYADFRDVEKILKDNLEFQRILQKIKKS